MNEKDYNPDERLDRMLRKWGVDEASRQVNIPPMPEMLPQRQWWTALLRWGPPAAAAAILLVAVGLFVTGRSDNTAAAPTEELQTLQAELARTKVDLQAAQTQLKQVSTQPTRELERLRAELALLKQNFKDKSDLLVRVEGRITNLNRIIGEQKEEMGKLAGELEKSGKALAAAKEHYDKLLIKWGKTQVQRTAAVSELDRVGKLYRRILTDSQKARTELVMLKARHKSVLGDFQRAYLSAAAVAGGMGHPGRRTDIAVRQSASRGARLPARCAEIRPSVQATSTGLLMDRLEVVLTRLNLLDPADPAEAKAFAELVRRSGLVKKINETLAGGRQRADIRVWLLETKLVLEGAENVG